MVLLVSWLYRADASLKQPYKSDLVGLLYEPTFKQLVGPAILTKLDLIRTQGNNAVHRTSPMRDSDSLPVVRELFHVMVWFATRYAPSPVGRPVASMPFDAASIPRPQPGAAARTMALSAFTGGTTLTGNQLSFVNMLVEQLTQRGVVDPGLVYEAPFTSVAPTGPDGLFSEPQVIELVTALRRIRSTAEAS